MRAAFFAVAQQAGRNSPTLTIAKVTVEHRPTPPTEGVSADHLVADYSRILRECLAGAGDESSRITMLSLAQIAQRRLDALQGIA